jgi:hypothetical protein
MTSKIRANYFVPSVDRFVWSKNNGNPVLRAAPFKAYFMFLITVMNQGPSQESGLTNS